MPEVAPLFPSEEESKPLGRWKPALVSPDSHYTGVRLLNGDFRSDYASLADYVATVEAAICLMPAPSERSEVLREDVRRKISDQNVARSQFLSAYLKQVYSALTDNFREHLTLTDLCKRGAEIYPALLPRPDQMAAELALPLNRREGRELSLACFVSAFLRNVDCGKHLLSSMRRPSPQAYNRLPEYSEHGILHLGPVTIERRGLAAIITLENGKCLNAEDLEFLTQLELAVDIALLSDNVRVGVVRGGVMTHPKYRGLRVFCAGINLRKLSLGQIPVVEYLLSREMGLIEKLRRGLSLPEGCSGSDNRHEKPWLGVIEGFAIGGGFQMLLNFDKVIASDEVYFSLPAAHEGIVPGSANFRLARHVGSKLSRRMILFGEKIFAASENGRLVCDEVVDTKSLEPAVDSAIDQLSGAAAAANRHMLNISDETEEELLNYLAEFCLVQAERALSKDVIAKVQNW